MNHICCLKYIFFLTIRKENSVGYIKVWRCDCGKIYDSLGKNLPSVCKKCGNEFYEYYKLYGRNILGEYEYVDYKLSKNIKRVVARKRFFKWEVLENEII